MTGTLTADPSASACMQLIATSASTAFDQPATAYIKLTADDYTSTATRSSQIGTRSKQPNGCCPMCMSSGSDRPRSNTSATMRSLNSSRKLLVVVFLLGTALCEVLATADASKPPVKFFSEWMSQRKPSKAAIAGYYGLEVEDLCMRETDIKGCSCYGRRGDKSCCWSFSVE